MGYDVLRPFDPSQPVLLVSTWESEAPWADFLAEIGDAVSSTELATGLTQSRYERVASFAVVDDDELEDRDGDPDQAPAQERQFAVDLFNATWDLLETEERSVEDDRTMLGSALASRLHWRAVGEPTNFSVSDWQVSRVFALLGDVARSKEYGQSALDIAVEYGLGPFYIGYAEEALARTAAIEGDADELQHWMARARASLDDVEDADARELLKADLDEIAASS